MADNRDEMDALARIFIGVRIPSQFRAQLADLQMNVRRRAMSDQIRWHSFDELLIPFAQPGELRPETVERLKPVVAAACAEIPPFRLELAGLEGVPNSVQPRWICMSLKGDLESLTRLQARVHQAVTSVVGPMESRPFQPQFMLGRLKIESESIRTALGRGLRLLKDSDLGEFEVQGVDIVRSAASTTGTSLVTVQHAALQGVSAPAS